jgi:hypothetical protein
MPIFRQTSECPTAIQAAVVCLLLVDCSSAGKRALGDLCARDGDCASGRCDELVCKAAAPAGAGEPCKHNLECRSEYCIDLCAQGLRGNGADCSDDLQCRSERCLAGVCVDGQKRDARVVDGAPGDGPTPDAAVVDDAAVIVDTTPRDMDTTWSWAIAIGSTALDRGYDLALDAAGNVFVTGRFRQTVDFGGQTLSSEQGLADGFVVSYASDGTLRWCERFGGGGDDEEGRGVAVASDGNVYLAGVVRPSTSSDVFVAGYRAGDGAPRWSQSFGGLRDDTGRAIAADDAGNVYVTGIFQDAADFGGGLLSSAGREDVYLASYAAADGSHRWSRRWGGEYNDYSRNLVVEGGNLYYTGSFSYNVDYGGGEFLSAGRLDVLVASYAATDGAHRWSLFFGSAEQDQGHGIAVDRGGRVYAGGIFSGTVDPGGGALTANGIWDAHLVSYGTADGAHRRSDHFGGNGETWGYDLVVGPAGHLYYSGHFSGTTNFGGGDLTAAGGHDIFVASFTAEGTHRWSRRFGGLLNDLHEGGLAVDAEGSVYLTGLFQLAGDFAGTRLVEAGGGDAFMMKIAGATLP